MGYVSDMWPFDAVYGGAGCLLRELDDEGITFMGEVPCDQYLFLQDPSPYGSQGLTGKHDRFPGPQFAFVSIALHCGVDCVNRPAELCGDFVVLTRPGWLTSTDCGCARFYLDGATSKAL